MCRQVVLFALVWITFASFCVGITRRDHSHLQRPRCTSRCLSVEAQKILSARYKARNGSRSSISVSDVMKRCLSSSRTKSCFLCLQPCQRPFYSLANCMELCNGELDCMFSCAFLSDMNQDKMGYCTAPTNFDFAVRVTYWAENSSYTLTQGHRERGRSSRSCNAECRSDFDCLSSKKCCNVECAPACRRAVIRKSWVPCLPSANSLTVKEKKTGKLQYAELSWSTKRKNDACTIYLVQEKSAIAKGEPKFRKYGWNTIHETTETRVPLMHLKRGWWYKYRIAAVNKNGTRGFSTDTKPFALSGNPRPPPSPVRLELSRIRHRSGAKYNILTTWKLGKDIQSDLPIKGFYITTRSLQKTKKKIAKENRRFVRFTKSVQSSGTVFWATWLTGLKFFVPYQVSASSASSWENELLIGPRAINITFQYPPARPTEVVRNLKADLPFQTWNGTVGVNITWDFWYTEAPADVVKFQLSAATITCFSGKKAEIQMVTLEGRKFHFLGNLNFACQYEVSVQALYGSFRDQMSDTVTLRFSTPPCGLQEKTILIGAETPSDVSAVCPKANPPKPANFVRFERLYQSMRPTADGKFSVELQWSRARWNPKYETVFLYLTYKDNTPLEWIYLPVKETSCILRSLPASRDYIASFVTVSQTQALLTAPKYFSTPNWAPSDYYIKE